MGGGIWRVPPASQDKSVLGGDAGGDAGEVTEDGEPLEVVDEASRMNFST